MKINVLVTSAGTAHAISIIKALKLQKAYPLTIFAVDSDLTAAGLSLADHADLIPLASAENYSKELLAIAKKYSIDVLFPTHSKEIEIVADMIPALEQGNIKTLLASANVIRLCNDKRRMNQIVSQLGIPVPLEIQTPHALDLPVILKLLKGSGSQGVEIVSEECQLPVHASQLQGKICQKFIAGQEYTVDCLANRDGKIIVASPRSRLLVKAGQSVKARTESIPILQEYCQQIAHHIGYCGPFNLQFIEHENSYYFIELNPRYAAGGLMLTVNAGANIPLLALELMLGKMVLPVTARTGILMVRYWEELFFEQTPPVNNRE